MKKIFVNKKLYQILLEASLEMHEFNEFYKSLKYQLNKFLSKHGITDISTLKKKINKLKTYKSFDIDDSIFSKIKLIPIGENKKLNGMGYNEIIITDAPIEKNIATYYDSLNIILINTNKIQNMNGLYTALAHEYRHANQYRNTKYSYRNIDNSDVLAVNVGKKTKEKKQKYINHQIEYDAHLGELIEHLKNYYFDIVERDIYNGNWTISNDDIKLSIDNLISSEKRFKYYNEKMRKKAIKYLFRYKGELIKTINYNYSLYKKIIYLIKMGYKPAIKKLAKMHFNNPSLSQEMKQFITKKYKVLL